MMFTRVLSLVGFVLSTSVLVASAPIAILGSHTSEIGLRCTSASCASAVDVLSLVTNLQGDVHSTLASLNTCEKTGSNPAPHFIKLATLVETCQGAVAALQVDPTGGYAGIKDQVSGITASIMLDVSTECGKFKNVKINGFVYVDLCAKIDIALKGLCVTLNGLLNGCLKLISMICLSNSVLLSNANFKLCLSLFASLGLLCELGGGFARAPIKILMVSDVSAGAQISNTCPHHLHNPATDTCGLPRRVLATMDVTKAIETYIDKMLSNPAAIKVLLLDSHTTPIVSLSTTQSNLLSNQVYLTDSITNKKRDRMVHMKCVCFLRPSESSLEALGEELKEPKYGEYYLYFSNALSKVAIERLAEQDEYEVEHFADYAPVLPSLFSLNHTPKASTSTSADGAPLPFSPTGPLYGVNPNSWDPAALERSIQGICAVLLSLKKKPIIRYERMSGMARKLGTEVLRRIQAEPALFDFRLTQVPPLLLIVDRRNDPVTPLLTQWTYQAMVHELLEIQNSGRVDLSMVPDIRPELQQITLTPPTDPFFAQNLFANFGDLGATIQEHVKSYQAKTASQTAIESIADMKRFVEEYPEFRKLGGNVSKHVAVVGELSRLVGRDSLLEVSEVEQNLAGRDNHAADFKAVMELIQKPGIQLYNKIRLAIIYALRYQKSFNQIGAVVEALIKAGASESDASLVYVLLNIAGADQRQDDLFENGNIFSRGKSALKGLKGVENVYTQHSPHLAETLENLLRGRLREQSYPFVEGQVSMNAGLQKPQDVIVFMVGGTTYEEARSVALMNQDPTIVGSSATGATRILLGGTCVHNSSSFLEMISHAAEAFPPTVYAPPPETAAGAAGPSLNLNLGGLNVSVGGPGGTGVFRAPSSAGTPIVSLDTGGQGAMDEGLREVRDGVRNFFGKVKQGVDRMGDQLK